MKNLIKVKFIFFVLALATASCEAPEENDVLENEKPAINSSEQFLIDKSKVQAPGGK